MSLKMVRNFSLMITMIRTVMIIWGGIYLADIWCLLVFSRAYLVPILLPSAVGNMSKFSSVNFFLNS